MNLRTIKSNVARWLRPTEKDKAEITRQISERLRYNRQLLKRSGTVWDDQEQAQKIAQSRRRRLRFWLNQRLISAEKRRVEPTAKWVYGADLFKIIERLSPTLEALGVIAIPLVLFFATQRYQDGLEQRELEKLQQETVANYLNQLSTILLDVDGDLRDPQNEKLRTLTTATTLTLLLDHNLDSERRSQVMEFLREMKLVDRDIAYGPKRPDDIVAILNFSGVDLSSADLSNSLLHKMSLSGANLQGTNFSGAVLSYTNLSETSLWAADMSRTALVGADLSGASLWATNLSESSLMAANLSGAVLRYANLSETFLDEANLSGTFLDEANLSGASLWAANLSGAVLSYANLSGAHLGTANMSGADLSYADLSGAVLSYTNLSGAKLVGANLIDAFLCQTQLPKSSQLDPNRDCETLKKQHPWRFDNP